MHEFKKVPVLIGAKNFELLSGGNVQEVNIDEQFSVTRVESEHQLRQQTSPTVQLAFFDFFVF